MIIPRSAQCAWVGNPSVYFSNSWTRRFQAAIYAEHPWHALDSTLVTNVVVEGKTLVIGIMPNPGVIRLDARSFISLHDYGLVLGESGMERLRAQCAIPVISQDRENLFLLDSSAPWLEIRGQMNALDLLTLQDRGRLSVDHRPSIGINCWATVRISTSLYWIDVEAVGETTLNVNSICESGFTPYDKEAARDLWRRGRVIRVGCASLGCQESFDVDDPCRKDREARLFAHIATFKHPLLIDGRHANIHVEPASEPAEWIVCCGEGCAWKSDRRFEVTGSRQDAGDFAMRHLKEHIVARQEPSNKNFQSTLFHSWPRWFPSTITASRTQLVKSYPEVSVLNYWVEPRRFGCRREHTS